MLIIRKKTKKGQEVINAAKSCKVYTLSNGFTGEEMKTGGLWATFGQESVTLAEFLSYKWTAFKEAKLTQQGSTYTLKIHSNLWYEFAN